MNNFQHNGMKELYAQFTKKETLKCNNYRPITLLTIAYIVYLLYY
jgi:hypothetical protein